MQGLVFKAAALGYVRLATLALSPLLLTGCGDDDDARDAGPEDGGMDGGEEDAFVRPRHDGQVGADPVPECDRFDPDACGAGERCQVVARRAAGAEQFVFYTGCLDDGPARSEGDPCDPFGGGYMPYRADGLDDELYADPCGEGLFCAADPAVRGGSTCQRSCQSGRHQGFLPVRCDAIDAFCLGPSQRPLEEVCRKGDTCDPTSPAGCGPGTGCYLLLNDTETAVLTVCIPVAEMPLANGAACRALNECQPGSSCWGPTRLPPASWESLQCRRSCTVGEEDSADAGADEGEDGGISGGSCGECVGFDESGLDVSVVSATLGQCE
jgi:hypothetical protein